jgi:hypothetical protein
MLQTSQQTPLWLSCCMGYLCARCRSETELGAAIATCCLAHPCGPPSL